MTVAPKHSVSKRLDHRMVPPRAEKGHHLQLFAAGCRLCTAFEQEILIGKCRSCRLETIDLRDPNTRALADRYAVRVAPTLVIDGRIMVEGRLDEPWVCGDEFYQMLMDRFPLNCDASRRA